MTDKTQWNKKSHVLDYHNNLKQVVFEKNRFVFQNTGILSRITSKSGVSSEVFREGARQEIRQIRQVSHTDKISLIQIH